LASPDPAAVRRNDPGLFGADAGRGRGAVGVRGDDADGCGIFQPVTRGELSKIFGKEVSRDIIGSLRGAGFIGSGPRSPTPGAPYSYVTTPHFLSAFGMQTLRDLPNIEALEDAGLLSRHVLNDEVDAPNDEEDEMR
jgi:segregation and condensation protein B